MGLTRIEFTEGLEDSVADALIFPPLKGGPGGVGTQPSVIVKASFVITIGPNILGYWGLITP